MHRLEVADAPGIRDHQLHSVVVSHFNKNIALNDSSYAKLTKVRRSISNLAEKNRNKFLACHTENIKSRESIVLKMIF